VWSCPRPCRRSPPTGSVRGPEATGTPVPICRGDRDTGSWVTHTEAVLRRFLPKDPHSVRRVTYGLAGAVCVLSMLTSAAAESETDSWLVVLTIPVTAVLALYSRRWRSVVLGVGAGIVAVWVPDAVFLWPALAAMVFVSVAEDQRDPPWAGWIGGFVGGTASLLFFTFDSNIAPFVATFLGGGAAHVLRGWIRSTELEEEAEELRGQAEWLAQRTSVARELHDVVGHHVTAMVVQAESGQLADPQEALRTIAEVGRTALAELDSLVVHLRDPGAPLTVTAPPQLLDIDELLADPLRRAGVDVDVQIENGLALDEPTLLTVYRITQEALTNIARHAGAGHAWVALVREGESVRLRVSDDGVGQPSGRTRGSGLLGIEERVAARGGRMELSGRPGGGSMLDVSLPVDET
jgi:signal transduction histidine kinase